MDAHTLDATNLAERPRWEQQEFRLHLEAASALEKYPAKQHARRVQEKLGVSDGLVYLPGQPSRNNEDSDMPAPFRQRRYFYYMSGVNEPNCSLLYDIRNDVLTLFVPRIDEKRVIWTGRGSNPAEALDRYDIDEAFWTDTLQTFVRDWLISNPGNIYALHTFYEDVDLSGPRHHLDLYSLQPAMNLARMVKDEHEVKMIRKANDISSQAHKLVLANIARFKNEAQVEGLFLDVCTSMQAKQQAYDIIAASGPNAGTLHYDENNQDFEDRQLMCLDAGCEYMLYASDITRTFPLSGKWPSKEAEDVYMLVQRMQETCIKRIAPGVRYLDLHVLAHQIAIDGLLNLGILHNGSREEIYKTGTSKAFFPHGLGHHVGLEVHDVGQADLMSTINGNTPPSLYPENFHLPVYNAELCFAPVDPQSSHLQVANVVTVEPGIYFSAYALETFYRHDPVHSKYINFDVVKRYLPVGGVRIEDDILVTSKGYENLTSAPKGEAMIKIIRDQDVEGPLVSNSAAHGPTRKSRSKEHNQPLLHAPDFSQHTSAPVLKPAMRAATAPIERKGRASTNLEPFAVVTDFDFDSFLHGTSSPRPTEIKPRVPICGENSSGFKHTYMDSPADTDDKPACRQCSILVQTLGRLRYTLARADESLPKRGSTASTKPTNEEQRLAIARQLDPVVAECRRVKPVVAPRQPAHMINKVRSLDTSSSMANLDRLPQQAQWWPPLESRPAVSKPTTSSVSPSGTTRPPFHSPMHPNASPSWLSGPRSYSPASMTRGQVVEQPKQEIVRPFINMPTWLEKIDVDVRNQFSVASQQSYPISEQSKKDSSSSVACQRCRMTNTEYINDGKDNPCSECRGTNTLGTQCVYGGNDGHPRPHMTGNEHVQHPVLLNHLTTSSPVEHEAHALEHYQEALKLLEQRGRRRFAMAREEQDRLSTTLDRPTEYQKGLMELEQQNKRRLLSARQEQEQISSHSNSGELFKSVNPPFHFNNSPDKYHALEDYERQLLLLEQQNRKRFQMARQEQEKPISPFPNSGRLFSPVNPPIHSNVSAGKNSALEDYERQLMLLEQQNRKRLLMARQEQEKPTPPRSNSNESFKSRYSSSHPSISAGTNPALGKYERSLLLLEQQNKERLLRERQEKEQQMASRPRAVMRIGNNGTARGSGRTNGFVGSSAPVEPVNHKATSQEDKMNKLHEAMDALWSVKEDMKREFGTVFSDPTEHMEAWRGRVEGDVRKSLGGAGVREQ